MRCFVRLHSRRSRQAAAALGLLFAASGALAADGPLGFADALGLAQSESRQLVAQDAAVAAARDMSVSAGQLPDPVLRLGIDNLPVDGADRFSTTADFMTMRRIGVMQEIPREEKRRLRGERGTREAEREAASRQAILANVQRDTALAWLDRYYAERMRAILETLMQDTRASIEAAQASYRGGRGTQGDVLAARAALVMLEDRGSMLERQVRAARIALARRIGADSERALGDPPDIRALRFDPDTIAESLRHHPQIDALAKQVVLAETEARLARAAKRPDWSVELAYQQRGPAFSNMVSIGVSIPLQIARGSRQDRDEAAKLALAEQARAQYEDALRAHTAEVHTMIADWRTGLERLERVERELVPLSEQRTQAALAAYRGNAGTLGAVLEARRNERDARIQALQAAAEVARAWAQLNFLYPDDGGRPHVVPQAGGTK